MFQIDIGGGNAIDCFERFADMSNAILACHAFKREVSFISLAGIQLQIGLCIERLHLFGFNWPL
jgi:hypothetical protein